MPASKTSGNDPVSGKTSYFRIKVSLVFYLIFGHSLLFAYILDPEEEKGLSDNSPYWVILLNVHACIKNNNSFYYIIFMALQLSKSVIMRFLVITLCYFRWEVLGLTSVGIDSLIGRRNNGSFFLRILTTQETILHVYKLGFLVAYVGIENEHTRSNSTFLMYLWLLLRYAMLCHWSSQWTCLNPNIEILSINYLNFKSEVTRPSFN